MIRELFGLRSTSVCAKCTGTVSARPDGWLVCSAPDGATHYWWSERQLDGEFAWWDGAGSGALLVALLPAVVLLERLTRRDTDG